MWTSYELFAHKSDIDLKIFGLAGGYTAKHQGKVFFYTTRISFEPITEKRKCV